MDFNDETGPGTLLPEGVYDFKIATCEAKESKAGKPMVVVDAIEQESGSSHKVYMTSVKGKRWLLKQLMLAAGLITDKDSVYAGEPEDLAKDLIGKEVSGEIKHEQEKEWIDRNGMKQSGAIKAKIASWKKPGEDTQVPF